MSLAMLLLALAQPDASAGTTRADDTINWPELRAMTPEALTRRMFGDLSTLVLPLSLDDQFPAAFERRLRFLSFRTRGKSTGFEGLCVSDSLMVAFEQAGPDLGPETRVRPYRVGVSQRYYPLTPGPISRAATPTSAREASVREASADAACRAVDPRQVNLIYSADVEQAVEALNDLAAVAATAASGALPALDCTMTARDDAPALDRTACGALVAALRGDHLRIVNSCFEPVAENCLDLQVNVSTVVAWRYGAGLRIETDALGRVLRVAVRRQPPPPPIIMTSE